jgi:hypothetical protein
MSDVTSKVATLQKRPKRGHKSSKKGTYKIEGRQT